MVLTEFDPGVKLRNIPDSCDINNTSPPQNIAYLPSCKQLLFQLSYHIPAQKKSDSPTKTIEPKKSSTQITPLSSHFIMKQSIQCVHSPIQRQLTECFDPKAFPSSSYKQKFYNFPNNSSTCFSRSAIVPSFFKTHFAFFNFSFIGICADNLD